MSVKRFLLFKTITWHVGYVYTVSGSIYSSLINTMLHFFTRQELLLFCGNTEAIVILPAYREGLPSNSQPSSLAGLSV